ncbi:ATP/GTP-binding protein [Cuniculiplasma sp. SKW4]|uniref:ATP/GTP-binding protein n=1 Tax=Cuniculiplasma sp. SKW4 TaxID=3400171 RepID=UPI003FD3D18A
MKGAIFVTGPAGTGKSSLCGAMKEWFTLNGMDSAIVNLDPGSEFIPYEADIDIREWIVISSIMSEFNLGPNGAQIVAADLIIEQIDRIKESLEELDDYYIIFDTPGQIELFTLRTSSPILVDALGGKKSMLAFVADAAVSSSASGHISQKLIYASVLTRFFKPTLFVMNKKDLIDEGSLNRILEWESEPESLIDDFMIEKGEMRKDYFYNVLNAFNESGLSTKVIPVSSKNMEGLEDIYSEMSLFLSGGEDEDTLYREENYDNDDEE